MKKFILRIVLVSLIVAILSWLVFYKLLPQFYFPVFPFVILFYAVVSVLIHGYQLKLLKKDVAKFTRNNMLITFIKLFLYSLIAFIYIALDKNHARVFVVYFVLLYIIFSFLEVWALLKMNSKR